MEQHIIAVVNQKGGVGKTTTSINLATSIAALRKKVLLVDLDPQGNATTGLGLNINLGSNSIYHAMVGQINARNVLVKTQIEGMDILPANMELSGAEVELANIEGRESYLKSLLKDFNEYDYIFIDCPPSLGMLTINALVAANEIFIPLQCEYFALEGLSHLVKTIDIIKHNYNENLYIKGILLTMYDSRNKLSKSVEDDVRAFYKDKVYSTVIPRNVKVSEAPSHGYPVIIYDQTCAGSKAYLDLAVEVLKKDNAI